MHSSYLSLAALAQAVMVTETEYHTVYVTVDADDQIDNKPSSAAPKPVSSATVASVNLSQHVSTSSADVFSAPIPTDTSLLLSQGNPDSYWPWASNDDSSDAPYQSTYFLGNDQVDNLSSYMPDQDYDQDSSMGYVPYQSADQGDYQSSPSDYTVNQGLLSKYNLNQGTPANQGSPNNQGPPADQGSAPSEPASEDAESSSSGEAAASAPEGLAQDIVSYHNKVRAIHHVGELTWSAELAGYASNYLAGDYCDFKHSGGPHGENLALGYLSIDEAQEAWYMEKDLYDYAAGRFSLSTGHFTQLVWKDTNEVGCATAECPRGTFLVCEYSPQGNIIGQFQENVFAE